MGHGTTKNPRAFPLANGVRAYNNLRRVPLRENLRLQSRDLHSGRELGRDDDPHHVARSRPKPGETGRVSEVPTQGPVVLRRRQSAGAGGCVDHEQLLGQHDRLTVQHRPSLRAPARQRHVSRHRAKGSGSNHPGHLRSHRRVFHVVLHRRIGRQHGRDARHGVRQGWVELVRLPGGGSLASLESPHGPPRGGPAEINEVFSRLPTFQAHSCSPPDHRSALLLDSANDKRVPDRDPRDCHLRDHGRHLLLHHGSGVLRDVHVSDVHLVPDHDRGRVVGHLAAVGFPDRGTRPRPDLLRLFSADSGAGAAERCHRGSPR
mmetsp:Transcript_16936/g.40836  ORF Transcript_16936/g.40836 Transcript_16936/m.40836 type:complete len:318 (+) Transcript_16936:172-1125(+)